MLREWAPKKIVELTDRRYARPTVSRTFEGRDRFAPAAAWLAKGTQLTALGRPAPDYHRLDIPVAVVDESSVTGVVLRVDRFGNVVTNIDRKTFESVAKSGSMEVAAGARRSAGWSPPMRTSRRERSARSSAAPTISSSRPTPRARPTGCSWAAAAPSPRGGGNPCRTTTARQKAVNKALSGMAAAATPSSEAASRGCCSSAGTTQRPPARRTS